MMKPARCWLALLLTLSSLVLFSSTTLAFGIQHKVYPPIPGKKLKKFVTFCEPIWLPKQKICIRRVCKSKRMLRGHRKNTRLGYASVRCVDNMYKGVHHMKQCRC